ncbi:hypothetical protein FRB99_004646, partial [Tulasnella sp. 403]
MRVRVVVHPPLPEQRFWYGFDTNSQSSVGLVKERLLKELAANFSSSRRRIRPELLRLELDGFELVDSSPSQLVLQDGDLVEVKIVDETSRLTSKRKIAPDSDAEDHTSKEQQSKRARLKTASERPKKAEYTTTPSSESESDDTNSSDTNTESSSSSSSSDEDSETDTDSTSSDSSSLSEASSLGSAPSVHGVKTQATRKLLPNKAAKGATRSTPPKPRLAQPAHSADPRPSVPPGQGKHSTHERNRRRRIARKAKADAASSLIPLQDSPSVPNGNASNPGANYSGEIRPSTAPQLTSTPLMMTGLKTSNKRKGFKDRLDGRTPEKIVFAAAGQPARTPSRVALPDLVPPSEQPNRPPNLVITSVDVESHLWNSQSTPRRNENGVGIPRTRSHPHDGTYNDTPILDYGIDEDAPKKTSTGLGVEQWNAAELAWDRLPQVNGLEDLGNDSTVAWK